MRASSVLKSRMMEFTVLTKEDYKKMSNFIINYATSPCPFGQCLLGMHKGKICYLSFFDEGKENSAIDFLLRDWPGAKLVPDDQIVGEIEDIFKYNSQNQKVIVCGTDLQIKVWKELLNIKMGETVTYSQIAEAVGNPKAVRAVGSAIGRNKIAYVIPCHRVINKGGAPQKYGWGPERKIQILNYEKDLAKT